MWQDTYKTFGGNVELYEGLTDPTHYADDNRPKLLILDDILLKESDSDVILNVFTKGSHQRNTSVFLRRRIYYINVKTIVIFH